MSCCTVGNVNLSACVIGVPERAREDTKKYFKNNSHIIPKLMKIIKCTDPRMLTSPNVNK